MPGPYECDGIHPSRGGGVCTLGTGGGKVSIRGKCKYDVRCGEKRCASHRKICQMPRAKLTSMIPRTEIILEQTRDSILVLATRDTIVEGCATTNNHPDAHQLKKGDPGGARNKFVGLLGLHKK